MEFKPTNKDATYSANDVALIDGQYFILRRRNASTFAFSPQAPRAASATVTFPAMPLAGMTDWFSFAHTASFEEDAQGNELGTIRYRFSLNNGTTWRYWNAAGPAWAVSASTAQVSTAEEIDTNLDTLLAAATSYGTKQVVVQAVLASDASRSHSPKLFGVSLGVEIETRPMEDALRSVVRFIQDEIAIHLFSKQKQATTGATMTLDTPFASIAVTAAYNLTTDPNRTTDIYSSIAGKVVTFTGAVTSGQVVEVAYTGKPLSITPGSEEEFFTANLPIIGVKMTYALHDNRWVNYQDMTISEGQEQGRVRAAPDHIEGHFKMWCMAARNTDSHNMVRALAEMFARKQCLFIPTGECMPLIRMKEFDATDIDMKGLFVKAFQVHLGFKAYNEAYTQHSVVKDVRIFTTDTDNREFGDFTVSRE